MDDRIDNVKQFYDLRFSELEKRMDEKFKLSQESLRIADTQLDKRLEAMNGFREALNDQNLQMARKSEVDTVLSKIEENVETRLNALHDKIDTLKQTNWPLLTGLATILISSVAAVWLIIGLKIDATNQPLMVNLEQIKTASASRDRTISDIQAQLSQYQQAFGTSQENQNKDISSLLQDLPASRQDRDQLNQRIRVIEGQVLASKSADVNSMTDRSQLNERLKSLENDVSNDNANRKANEAGIEQKLIEIETQFSAVESVIALLKEHMYQWLSLLWQRTFPGQEFPRGTYNPTLHKSVDGVK